MHRELQMHGGHGADDADHAIDPVCGMTVNREDARDMGLRVEHEGAEYFFCGRGCKRSFQEDPARYLAPGHQPHM